MPGEEWKESLVFLDLKETCETDILKKMAEAMVREGYARDTYVEALLQREKSFPTGLDIHGIGIAIPHTDPCHVRKEGIALAVLKEPVIFGSMEDDRRTVAVRLIFMLAVLEAEVHLERLQSILNIIQDAEVLAQLLAARDQKQILQIIREEDRRGGSR